MSDGPPPAKRKKYNLTKSFDVLVGKEPEQQRFTVYHDLVTQRFEFFRAARSERWNPDPTKPTTLDDAEVEVFSAYLHCVNWGAGSLNSLVQSMLDNEKDVYQKRASDTLDISSTEDGSSSSDDPLVFLTEPVEKFLIDLYLLADKLIDPATANLTIDELVAVVEKYQYYFSSDLVAFLYESTTETSPLRTLVQDHFIYGSANTATLMNYLKGHGPFPQDFIKDLLFKVLTINETNGSSNIQDVYGFKKLQSNHYHLALDNSSVESADTASAAKEDK